MEFEAWFRLCQFFKEISTSEAFGSVRNSSGFITSEAFVGPARNSKWIRHRKPSLGPEFMASVRNFLRRMLGKIHGLLVYLLRLRTITQVMIFVGLSIRNCRKGIRPLDQDLVQ